MDYSAVVEALYERHRSVRDAGFSGSAYKPGLDAMLSFADFLGHPEQHFRSIHVAGTNGKGSVCSMLAAALAARGLHVGLYTSPHLVDFRERIKIIGPVEAATNGESPSSRGTVAARDHVNGRGPRLFERPDWSLLKNGRRMAVGGMSGAKFSREEGLSQECGGLSASTMIPEEAVCEFLERYDREGLTFFEVTTGMAFWWFAEQKVDVAVIETGLGGRLDSTNIITPEISVITSIGLDHCDLLGSTRAEIAAEKAGIFKPGVPALVWGRDSESQPVFERIAATVGSPLYFAEDYPLPATNFTLDLSGPCQDINLRTVLAAQYILHFTPTERQLEALAHAARITGLRGRWEQLLEDPLTICDIGHNPPAMEANMQKLMGLGRPVIIVYGAMKDKDVDDIKHYLPADATYYLVQPQTPRAMPLPDLALKLKSLNPIAAGTVQQGVGLALEHARQNPGAIVYIGGSTFVVSEAITYIESL